MKLNYFLYFILLVLVVINFNLSKQIISWVKSKSQIFALLTLLWFVPFVGAYYIYTKDNISPVWGYNSNNEVSGTTLGSGLLALDVFYNPAAKNRIEGIEQQKIYKNIMTRQSDKLSYEQILINLSKHKS